MVSTRSLQPSSGTGVSNGNGVVNNAPAFRAEPEGRCALALQTCGALLLETFQPVTRRTFAAVQVATRSKDMMTWVLRRPMLTYALGPSCHVNAVGLLLQALACPQASDAAAR